MKVMDLLAKKSTTPSVKIGDKVLAGNTGIISEVRSVTHLPDARVEMLLDWGQHGTSKVYLHDHGKTWKFKVEVN